MSLLVREETTMRTYIYSESDSRKRGFNKCITVWRIKRNRPHLVGSSDHHTASWYGARGCAQYIINDAEGIPIMQTAGGFTLKGLLGFADLYSKTRGDGIRLFAV